MATDLPSVLVAIPAHDEELLIAACLTSVAEAIATAQRQGVISGGAVAVCAHRCRDATADIACELLAGQRVGWLVTEEAAPRTVGQVRNLAVAAAKARWGPDTPSWIFSTDADSVVPSGWVADLLAEAGAAQADLVLGLTELSNWLAGETAQSAYAEILAAGMSDGGHEHAYAANLAIRRDVFEQVGGFGTSRHGEEHHLAAAVRAAGGHVLSVCEPRVLTSGRMPGRAAAGLGALLSLLAREAPS